MISVVIPCAGEEGSHGLWHSVASAMADLEHSKLEFEIICVINRNTPSAGWILINEDKRVKNIFAGPSIADPQSARHYGFTHSQGDPVFFMDSHVVIPPGMFATALEDIESAGADFLGIGHRFDAGLVYASHCDWDDYMWCRFCQADAPLDAPFRVATYPHGCFAVRRESYQRAGGYFLGMKGWGGEEVQLSFKFWAMGLELWATPRTYHFHWLPPSTRHTKEVFSKYNFVRNFLLIAAIFGDRERVDKSYAAFMRLHWGGRCLYPLLRKYIFEDQDVVAERAFIAKHAKFASIDELRAHWAERGDVLL